MTKAFDVALDALSPKGSPDPAPQVHARHAYAKLLNQAANSQTAAPSGKSFYIETFGCQMNAHDSEKVSGVLLARGYRAGATRPPKPIWCSTTLAASAKKPRRKFSRASANGAPPRATPDKIIGVLGCVAQQEGEEIFERAPWVSLVCGSASYQKLPQLMDELESGGRRVTGLDLDTDETFETEITRRDNPIRAYITIIEGCDYACSYCVVPHTRGPERSRPSDAVLAEARRLADAGYTEIQLLGQTVNSYRDPSPRGGISSICCAPSPRSPGIRRVRFTTSHPNDFTREIVEAIDAIPALCDHVHLPGAIGLDAHSARNAPHLHARGVSRKNFLDSRRAPPHQHHQRHHRRLSRRNGRGFRGNAHAARRRRLRRRLLLQIFAAAQHLRRQPCPTPIPEEEKSRAPRRPSGTPAPDSDRAQRKADRRDLRSARRRAITPRATSGPVAPPATEY